MMSYWVHRGGTTDDLVTGQPVARSGWVGPLEGLDRAEREARAWRACGWTATIHLDTPETRARVATWEVETMGRWRDSTDPTQRRRYHERLAETRRT